MDDTALAAEVAARPELAALGVMGITCIDDEEEPFYLVDISFLHWNWAPGTHEQKLALLGRLLDFLPPGSQWGIV